MQGIQEWDVNKFNFIIKTIVKSRIVKRIVRRLGPTPKGYEFNQVGPKRPV
jgi:hypothetical protein